MRHRKATILAASALILVAATVGAFVRNAGRPSPPRVKPGRITVAAIGDSNTWGMGVMYRGRRRRSYPARLESLLGSGHQVLNYGLNGRTLLSTGDFPYDKNRFARITVDTTPDVVLIMLGTNDSKPYNWNAGAFEAELSAFIARYTNLAHTPRVFAVTPPVAFKNRMSIDPVVIRNEVVPIIRRVAASMQVPLIDVFAATDRGIASHPDGVHPDAEGLDLVARTIHAGLLAAEAGQPRVPQRRRK